MTEVLSTLDGNQLQKLLQYTVQVDPASVLGKMFQHIGQCVVAVARQHCTLTVDTSAVISRAVTVLRFHFRFSFAQKTRGFGFSRFQFLDEIWVKQTINCKRDNVIREPCQL